MSARGRQRRGPEVGFYCDACDRYSTWDPPFAPGDDRCRHCGHANPPLGGAAPVGDAWPPTGALDACLQCGNRELYTRKDLPQQIGCAVVLSAVVLSTVAYAIWDFPGAFAVFASVAVLDLLVYWRIGSVTVCYRCHAEFRRFPANPAHCPFDMHRAEEYDAGPSK